eukprot:754076-Hanusia_phi.AAC.2
MKNLQGLTVTISACGKERTDETAPTFFHIPPASSSVLPLLHDLPVLPTLTFFSISLAFNVYLPSTFSLHSSPLPLSSSIPPLLFFVPPPLLSHALVSAFPNPLLPPCIAPPCIAPPPAHALSSRPLPSCQLTGEKGGGVVL